jgi:hypothetical protein
MAKTRKAASQDSSECPESMRTRKLPMPGIRPRKDRSTAGTALEVRLIEVPLSPPVAMVRAKTVPPAARMLMAKPTRMMSAFSRQVEERHDQPEQRAGPDCRRRPRRTRAR